MKQTKFRVFDKTTGEMYQVGEDTQLVFGMDGQNWSLWTEEGMICDNDDAYLIQFTGLTDKNGKEIYEGDIVRWKEIVVDYETFFGPNIPTPTNEYTERIDTRVQTCIDNVVFAYGSFRLSRDADNEDEAYWIPTHFTTWYGNRLNISDVDIEDLTEDDYFKEFGYDSIDALIKDVTSGIEVIGNIYQNPKLLKKEETQ